MDQEVTHPAGPICYPSIRLHRGEQSKYHRHRREGRVDRSGVAVARLSGLRAVSRYQWLVFLVVWLGWTLDAADFGLYSLVLKPAMTELLGGNPSIADIGKIWRPAQHDGALGLGFRRISVRHHRRLISAGCARSPSASRSTVCSPSCKGFRKASLILPSIALSPASPWGRS